MLGALESWKIILANPVENKAVDFLSVRINLFEIGVPSVFCSGKILPVWVISERKKEGEREKKKKNTEK